MALANVLIEHLARHDEDAVGDARKDLLCHLHSPTRADGRDRRLPSEALPAPARAQCFPGRWEPRGSAARRPVSLPGSENP